MGLNKGDVYEHLLNDWGLKENKHYIVYSAKFEEVDAFKRGKLDLIIASANSLQFHLDNRLFKEGDLVPVYHISDKRLAGNYLALNKNTPRVVIEQLQGAIDYLRDNQFFTQIKTKYITQAVDNIAESEISLTERCKY